MFFDILHTRVHHPDIGKANIADETMRAAHEAKEDGGLLRHNECGKGDTYHHRDIFTAVSEQHLHRDVIH